jgi:hypothetical protein
MPNQNAIFPGGTKIIASPFMVGSWANPTATSGTDSAVTNGTGYYVGMWLPGDAYVNGVKYLIGSVGGTDKVIASIHDSGGTVIANSAVAGATVGTAAQTQDVILTAPILIPGPGLILVMLTFNGTTAKFRSILAYGNAGSGVIAGSATQTFGTVAAFTPSTTLFTADKGPICSLIPG